MSDVCRVIITHHIHFFLRLRLHIDPQRYMVRESTRINLKRENQPLVEYMPVSSPTKCIACSLDTYRGALYPIFITFACVFAFISTLKGGCRVCTIDCCVVSNGFFWRELFYAGAYVCEKNMDLAG